MSKFLSNKYENLLPYTPGEQPKDKEYIKLNTNESPFSPSKKAIKKVKKEVEKLHLYPDPEQRLLTQKVATFLGVKREEVLLTNGSDEILNFAFMAYCDSMTPAVFADITYGFYSVFAGINNVPKKIIPLKEDFSIKKEDYFNAKGTIFIANPNAPTGMALTNDDIRAILDNNKDNIVVIDEAYVDFYGESAIPLIREYDNLLVTRTFSKSRAMAGARLGFGVASETLIKDLNAIKYSTNPYNVNRLSAIAGVASIDDKRYYEKCLNSVIFAREYLKEELKNLGFSMTDSVANFIFAKSDKISGEDLYKKLKEKGVLVRYFNKERISDYVRITIGTKKQMEVLVKIIKEILGS